MYVQHVKIINLNICIHKVEQDTREHQGEHNMQLTNEQDVVKELDYETIGEINRLDRDR